MSMSIAWLFFFAQTSSRSYRAFLYSREKQHTNTRTQEFFPAMITSPPTFRFLPRWAITIGSTCLVG